MSDEFAAHARWIGEALRHFESPLMRYALRFTGDVEHARDIVQDTFLKLCSQDAARLDGHMAQWLYTVCRNRALDVGKKERRMETLDREAAEAQPAQGTTPNVRAEVRDGGIIASVRLVATPRAILRHPRPPLPKGISGLPVWNITRSSL